MNRMMSGVASLGAGAAAMYLLDPDRGARRRALIRDKIVRGAHKSSDGLSAASRDLANRTSGAVAEARGWISEQEIPDRTVEARVRSALGRYSSHPRAIEASASNGRVTLRGLTLSHEADQVVRGIEGVRGVMEVVDELERHDSAENIPALQGGTPPGQEGWLQGNWSPATRLVAGGVGLALMGYCASRRDAPTGVLGTAGFALVLRAAMNSGLEDLFRGETGSADEWKTGDRAGQAEQEPLPAR
jgi:hypothetical protein